MCTVFSSLVILVTDEELLVFTDFELCETTSISKESSVILYSNNIASNSAKLLHYNLQQCYNIFIKQYDEIKMLLQHIQQYSLLKT